MVQSLRDLNIIVNHFERYPFLTKKREDFILFAQIVTLINKREHLTPLGLREIISLKASMNLARLSPLLKIAFQDIIPAIRPKRSDDLLNLNIDPY